MDTWYVGILLLGYRCAMPAGWMLPAWASGARFVASTHGPAGRGKKRAVLGPSGGGLRRAAAAPTPLFAVRASTPLSQVVRHRPLAARGGARQARAPPAVTEEAGQARARAAAAADWHAGRVLGAAAIGSEDAWVVCACVRRGGRCMWHPHARERAPAWMAGDTLSQHVLIPPNVRTVWGLARVCTWVRAPWAVRHARKSAGGVAERWVAVAAG